MTTPTSKTYWRSLAELEGTEDFQTALHREFPPGAENTEGFDRRRFLQVMGASVALAGAQSCRWEKTNILPLAERPEDRVPGVPTHYATSFELGGVAQPLVITSYDGRPIKIEGNEMHPASQGAASVFAQASILELYDPGRSTAPHEGNQVRAMADFDAALAGLRTRYTATQGAGLDFLMGVSSSPALGEAVRRLGAALPRATVTYYEPLSRDREREGARLAYGRPLRTHYDLAKASRIACFDADLLGDHPNAIAHTRAFSYGRRPEGASYDAADFGQRSTVMNRAYVVEPRFTTTGASADHRLPLRAEQVGAALAALEAVLVAKGLSVPSSWGSASEVPAGPLFAAGSRVMRFIEALAQDLFENRGKSVVAVGGTQARAVHALAHRINTLLGNVGTTVHYTAEPDEARPAAIDALRNLVQRMNGKEVETLVVLGGNPVYDAPRSLDFKAALGRVATSIHVSLYRNETSRLCGWHAPIAHYLESWGDALAYDGSYCVVQPLIRPIFGAHSALELVSYFADGAWGDAQLLARAGCQAHTGAKTDKEWQRAIHDGFVASSAARTVDVTGKSLAPMSFTGGAIAAGVPERGQLELVLHGDACLYDGRFGNNAWLQELPDFMTKLTWDNAAMISPATATALKLTTGDLAKLTIASRSLDAVVYVMPGQAAGSISLALGYGRTAAGHVGGDAEAGIAPAGFDAYVLTSDGTDGHESGLTVTNTGSTYPLALTADHHLIDETGAHERDGEWLDPTKTYPDRTVVDASGATVALTTPALVERFNAKAKKGSRVSELIKETTAEEYTDFVAAVAKDGGRAAVDTRKNAGHGGGAHGGDAGHGANGANGHSAGAADAAPAGHGADMVMFAEGAQEGGGHHAPPYLDPNHIKRFSGPPLLSLWERKSYDGHRWGLSIDLSSCTGCNACVVACQSENNIPVVGKEQVSRGREMQWIRIDRYFSGDPDDPQVARQPVACLQCEDAPCEEVCPVAATVHSDEGLNDMVYNRCIGTRYCSNNCPVKVRRFNYFNYHRNLKNPANDLERMVYNPEVTVRSRGVMEKCTYCVQRIQNVKIKAKVEGRRAIRDGEIVTACQQTCPADAIRFGDLSDQHAVVSKAHASERSYKMLEFLNIRPRTAFLARVTNPNSVLVEA